MPRWKALPDELDPEVREFTSQLRRLVDRSGLSIAAIADRTGYSKTSWERYLNGRLLAPKRAIVSLAEVTGTNPVHLNTMWELAERAWSRSEMRHDMTMEAIRISQARAALGEFGAQAASEANGRAAQRGATSTAGPVGVAPAFPPSVPQQPGPPGAESAPHGGLPPVAAPPQGGSPDRQRQRRKATMFLVGIVGALVVIAAAVLLTGVGKGDGDAARAKPAPTAKPTTSAPVLPAGVQCSGKDCTGKDPQTMGCGGELAKTTGSVTVGTALVEVRYSRTCGAAWARVTRAAAGDKVVIRAGATPGAASRSGTVDTSTDAYTPMVAVKSAAEAKACATLTSGRTACTQ
ncbi:DUF2690 domain-containing protein [Streptomyces sp. NPDC002004]